jgi:hypothetical protein
MLFGDGGRWPSNGMVSDCPSTSGTRAQDITHVYNRAGRWEFNVQTYDGGCGTPNMAYGSLFGWLDVSTGTMAPTAQGPSQPVINQVGEYRSPSDTDYQRGIVKVWAKAEDEDGFISSFTIDYGDGSPAERFPGDQMGCQQTTSGWPAHSLAWTPTNPPPTHQYAAPGGWTIHVTVTSTGCDGRDPQTVSGSFTWSWPG